DRRTDQAPDQGVARTGWDREIPGDQVPQDRADQGRQDEDEAGIAGQDLRVDDPLGNRCGDADRDERAGEVEDRRERDGHSRLEGTARDRGRHRVGGVVKPVGEVERQRRDHHEDEDEHDHLSTARSQAGSGFSSCKPGDTAITRTRDGRIGRVERGVHDRGGMPTDEQIDRREHALEDWEVLTDALVGALAQRGLVNVDELRRGIESIPPAEYERASYYERWLLSIETILTEKGVLAPGELDRWAAR